MFSICGPIYLSFDTYECPLPSLILANQNSVPNVPPKLPKQRSIAVSAMTFSSKHRHVVFTIAEELRYFLKDITHFLIFFSSHLEISSMPWEMMINTGKTKDRKDTRTSKSPYFYKDTTNNVVFGAISTFHTFGISLDFNFHIHMLVCEKTNLKTNDINNFSYMNFAKLRKPRCFRFLSSWKKKFIPIKNS